MSRPDRPLGQGRRLVELVLLSADTEYAADLEEYLRTTPADIVLRAVVVTQDELREAVQRYPGCLVLVDAADGNETELAGPAAGREAALTLGAQRVLVLVDNPHAVSGLPAGTEAVFKYAMGSTLVECIRSLPGTPVANKAPLQPSLGEVERPTVIAFYSPRGGAGCSTLAANLAYLYSAKGKRVALVDLARYGSQHILLRQPQRGQGLSSLVTLLSQEPGAARSERLNNHLQQALQRVTVQKSSFHLLPAVAPMRAAQINAEHVQVIISQILASGCQVVIVDLSADLDSRTVGALTAANRIVIPVLPEIVSAWHALKARDALAAVLGSRANISFLLNRMRRDAGFLPDEFSQLGGTPLLGSIPDEYRRVHDDQAVGRLSAIHDKSPFTQALRRVANLLYPVFSQEELKRGRWPWSRS